VNGWLEAKLLQDRVGVFFPEPWGLGMALHRGEDWDDMTVWDWRALFVVDPPFMKALSGRTKKPCFGGGALAKALETSDPKMSMFSAAAIA
jgi:hypothetical protein